MMRSMYSGVSGLRTHQTKMDVIGNNIANVNTTGFKSQRVAFKEVFSQTLQSASSANDETGRGGLNPMQVGLGVNISSIDMLMTQGPTQRTDEPFDLMIDGDGFMVVSDASGTYFTRDGALRKDDDGNLIIPNGMRVMGWQAAADGKSIVRSNVSALVLDSPENKTAKPAATRNVQLTGNLNVADAVDKDGKGTEEGITLQIKMHDSLGNLYAMNMKATYNPETPQTGDATKTGVWTMEPIVEGTVTILTDQNGKEHEIKFVGTVPLEFDTDGNLVGNKEDLRFVIESTEDGDDPFEIEGVNSTLGPITVDFSGITQYDGKTNIDTKTVDGRTSGTMMGYGIGPDGIITAHYDNGEFRLLGQVIIANFDNPAGLEKVGDNIYRQTANSGDFNGIGNAGIFQSGVLEASNVDLSKEFTEMIITQRGFQANSRIITTSDDMLQELVNLKR